MGLEFVTRRYWTLKALVGYLEPLSAFFSCDIGAVICKLTFNIQVRLEDKRVPAEYDNSYQLERPNRPTLFTTDRATDPTDRGGFLSHSCIFEPCYKLKNGFRHLKKVETQHHSRSNRVSLFPLEYT